MIASALLLSATAISGPAPANPLSEATRTVVARTAATAAVRPAAHVRGFAASLADEASINGPEGWPQITHAAAWAALAAATPATRPAARWAYARSLIGQGRGQEARGVLEVMLASDIDLALVDSFRLAIGAARAEVGDARGALAAIGDGSFDSGHLAANPEACAWRLWAQTTVGSSELALAQVRCALPALNKRSPAGRAAFLYAGARATLAVGRPAPVAAWLRALPDGDAGANLYRGRAALALGDIAGARLRLKRVNGGSRQQQVDSRVSLLEADIANSRATPAQIGEIDNLALTWRGDAIEQRVLRLSYRVGSERHDLNRSLAAGAALVRYFQLGEDAAPLLAEMQALLAAGLAPGSTLPLVRAAGLFWDYRDLAPAGAQGDFLVSQLADRLQAQGLFLRAAELLRHQLLRRAKDVAQGPLSARVANLYILAGLPTPALAAIHDTDANAYPVEIQWERHRVEAVALYKLGRRQEALAALQDVPDGSTIRAEIYWKTHDWQGLIAEVSPRLPSNPQLSAVEQAIVLREAIALAMLGREPALLQLRSRYASALKGLPVAATFDLLTGDPATLDANALTAAMLAVPSASPAGTISDLIDVAVAEPKAATRPRPAT